MKKLLLSTALATVLFIGAQAQSTTFGVKAGATAANMKFSGSGINLTFDTKIGFYAGAFAEIGISENFAVQPELFYSLMGAQQNIDLGGGSSKSSLDLSYINLPILAKYKSEGFSIFLGPQIGYLISAKDKSDGVSEDVKDEMKSIDISGVIGASYTLTNGFGFDARYQLGLTNIAEGLEGSDGTTKNNGFLFGVHYRFNQN